MWITQESHILSSTSLSHLNLKIYMLLVGLPFCHLPEKSDSFLLSDKSDSYTYLTCFAFICLIDSHWNFSGKSGMSTFMEILCTRPDHTFQEIMAWSLSGFPSGPLPIYIPFSIWKQLKLPVLWHLQPLPRICLVQMTHLASVSSKIQELKGQLAPRFNCPMALLAIAQIFWQVL